MIRLTILAALVAALLNTGCSSTIDTSGMEAGAMLRPTWHQTETDAGPSIDAGVRLSGPKLDLGLLPWGSPDGSVDSGPIDLAGGATKDELQSALDEQEARIAQLEEDGKVSAEEAAKLRKDLADARSQVDSSPTSKDEVPPIGELIAGNWIAAILLLLAWIFRRFIGGAVVGAGISKVVDRIKAAIDEYDEKPYEGPNGQLVSEEELVASATRSNQPQPPQAP